MRFGVLVDIDARASIAATPAFSGDGKASNGGAGGPPAAAQATVADYWRSKGFPYSAKRAQEIVPVSVRLDGGGFACTYPADQVRPQPSCSWAEETHVN